MSLQLMSSLRDTFYNLASNNPQFAFMYRGVRFLEGVNYIESWRTVHDMVSSTKRSVMIAGIVAAVLPVFACGLTWYLLFVGVKANLLLIRKGKADPELLALVSHNNAETYPAHQVARCACPLPEGGCSVMAGQ